MVMGSRSQFVSDSSGYTSGATMEPVRASGCLEDVAESIDQSMRQDMVCADVAERLAIERLDEPTVSGLHDDDYPDLSSIGLSEIEEVLLTKRSSIPSDLADQYSKMQTMFMMGLLPQLSRAWVSIDSDLFVWNYQSGTDLAYYDRLKHVILQVGFATPKPGVIAPNIHSLLVVATSVEIVLLAVTFKNGAGDNPSTSEMNLMPEPLFAISTDAVVISGITATDIGRIFLAGRDGCLYEFEYQVGKWLGKSCKKINHSKSVIGYFVPQFVNQALGDNEPLEQIKFDRTRRLLFTRSEYGSIQVFDLGNDGLGMNRIASVSAAFISQRAQQMTDNAIEPSNFSPIVHISPIDKSQSEVVHLVAITMSGVRFYFTCSRSAPTQGHEAYDTLQLVHVRLPPGFAAVSYTGRPQRVHTAFVEKDLCLMLAMMNDDEDVLWSVSGSQFPFYRRVIEIQKQFQIPGRCWAVAASEPGPSTSLPAINPEEVYDPGQLQPGLVVRQQMEGVLKFDVLTPQGLHTFERLRPFDCLSRLLRRYGADGNQVKAFFKLHKPVQACVMCLALICSEASAEAQVVEQASRAFFLYGGEAQIVTAGDDGFDGTRMQRLQETIPSPGALGVSPPRIASTPYPGTSGAVSGIDRHNVAPGSALTTATRAGASHAAQRPEVKFSRRHEAFSVLVSRLIGPLWNRRVTVPSNEPPPPGWSEKDGPRLSSGASASFLIRVLVQLERLLGFIDRTGIINLAAASSITGREAHGLGPNSTLYDSMGISSAQYQAQRKQREEAVLMERRSLQGLRDFVSRCCEVLRLWHILIQHQFPAVVSRLPKNRQEDIAHLSFRNLFVYGKDLCGDLCTAVITQYLGDNACVDSIADRLRESCPSLFTLSDATSAKASELLEAAQQMDEGPERRSMLQRSLQLFKDVGDHVNIPAIVAQFEAVHFYSGIVELCLSTAQRIDPQGLAIRAYENRDMMEVDPEADRLLQMRINCYRTITECLTKLLSSDVSSDSQLSSERIDQWSEEMLSLCLQSNDELCHVAIYDWLLEKKLTEKLLEIDSPYLEAYLQSSAMSSGSGLDTIQYLETLWKYYEKRGRFYQAAALLEKMADRHTMQMNLQRRIEYLSRAVVCAKSGDTAPARGNLLQDLEDKLEVACLQRKLLEALQNRRPEHPVIDAMAKLNAELYDITTLYQDFAEPFNLPECKLGIVQCANFSNVELIEAIWRDIIDEELNLAPAQSSDAKMQILSEKLISLSSFHGRSRYVPLDYLSKYLPMRSFKEGFTADFAPRTLLSMGANVSSLLETFYNLYKLKDPFWSANRRAQMYLAELMLSLLIIFTENPSIVATPAARRKITSDSLDCVAVCLVDLQSQPHSRDVIKRYQSVQYKLQGLV